MPDVWIKFCGCVGWSDIAASLDAGADAFGMIFAPSPRRIEWRAAEEIATRPTASIAPVAVFVDPTHAQVERVRALFPHAWLQFSGDESPEFVARYGERAIKAIHVGSAPAALDQRCARFARALLLFDTRHDGMAGGTATPFEWSHVASIAAQRRAVMAGGLTPANVAACLERTRPFGVDVRSGIETDGRKDAVKMRAFVRAVREVS